MSAGLRTRTPEARFLSHANPDGSGCHVWTGRTRAGYGRFLVSVGSGRPRRNVTAHRYAWERANGPVPEGFQVDHICHNRLCVNVAHLRLATPAQNRAHLQGARANHRTTGVRNVYPKNGGFRVVITSNGDAYRSQTFPTLEAASAHAEAKRLEIFGEFAGRG